MNNIYNVLNFEQRKPDWKEVEIDVMYESATVPSSARGAIEHVGTPGYVKVCVDPIYIRYCHPRIKEKMEHSTQYIQVRYVLYVG